MTANGRRITHAERVRGQDGYFSPDSEIRRIFGAPLVHVLAPGPAIYFQCAHPLVAASVVAHMEYESDHWQRWLRIFRASYLIVFGSRAEADAVVGRVRELHRRVEGTARSGERYAAEDPALLLWVAASLFESTSKLYGRYVRRLALEEQERFYGDIALVARLLGANGMPEMLGDYRVALEEQLAEASVTPEALLVIGAVFDKAPAQLRIFAHANRLAAAGLLPRRLRDEYGLAWTPAHAVALGGWAASFRAFSAPLALAAARYPQPVSNAAPSP